MTPLGIMELVCLAILPSYLIFAKGRFWSAFFLTWALLVICQEVDVHLPRSGGHDEPPDTTSVGLTLFTGWILALPYCVILNLLNKLYRRLTMQPP